MVIALLIDYNTNDVTRIKTIQGKSLFLDEKIRTYEFLNTSKIFSLW